MPDTSCEACGHEYPDPGPAPEQCPYCDAWLICPTIDSGEHIILPKGKIVDPKKLDKGVPERKLPPAPGQAPRPGDPRESESQ